MGRDGDENKDDPGRFAMNMEDEVEDLAKQVSAELQALAEYQDDLSSTKTTLTDLSEQMKDVLNLIAGCQKTSSELKKQFAAGSLNNAATPSVAAVIQQPGSNNRSATHA